MPEQSVTLVVSSERRAGFREAGPSLSILVACNSRIGSSLLHRVLLACGFVHCDVHRFTVTCHSSEGDNRLGLGHAIAKAIGDAGIT
jgi:hypothetical protein